MQVELDGSLLGWRQRVDRLQKLDLVEMKLSACIGLLGLRKNIGAVAETSHCRLESEEWDMVYSFGTCLCLNFESDPKQRPRKRRDVDP